jgi:hypothetical protein
MKTILVPIEADEGQDARLQAGFDLARACGGQVVAVQVTPFAAYAVGDTGMHSRSPASLKPSTPNAAPSARPSKRG